MRPLRVGIDAGLACSSRPTGVEHFARSVLSELLRIGDPAVEYFVYLPPYGDLGPVAANVHLRRRPDVNTLIKQPWLVTQTWRDRLDLLYTPGHQVPTACRGRRLITIYDVIYRLYPECYPPGAPERTHAEVAGACASATAVIVPSEATRADVVRHYGVAADRVFSVLAGIRDGFAPSHGDEPLPSVVGSAQYFLTVGRIDRRKNVERVITAYRALLGEGADCALVIVGPDDSGAGEGADRLAAGKVSGERVVTTGYVDEAELVSLYRRATALVYPSLAEGFGLPVLEAMACGTPVITSNVSSMPEVAGDAALLVDPHSTPDLIAAMREALTSPETRERLRKAGLRRASEFSWKRSAHLLQNALIKTGRESRVEA